eukprot:TRINITY_DN2879_c0_g1_i1.p1 TRINITY_DN2879_c0_g1~~TRINITY_DN2879_c0_g1_i1.p1  ORF type:complete len:344 (+),score=-26.39 TRINITY_DN2879_c0_g1_i1:337-1368(+)
MTGFQRSCLTSFTNISSFTTQTNANQIQFRIPCYSSIPQHPIAHQQIVRNHSQNAYTPTHIKKVKITFKFLNQTSTQVKTKSRKYVDISTSDVVQIQTQTNIQIHNPIHLFYSIRTRYTTISPYDKSRNLQLLLFSNSKKSYTNDLYEQPSKVKKIYFPLFQKFQNQIKYNQKIQRYITQNVSKQNRLHRQRIEQDSKNFDTFLAKQSTISYKLELLSHNYEIKSLHFQRNSLIQNMTKNYYTSFKQFQNIIAIFLVKQITIKYEQYQTIQKQCFNFKIVLKQKNDTFLVKYKTITPSLNNFKIQSLYFQQNRLLLNMSNIRLFKNNVLILKQFQNRKTILFQ